MCREPSKCTRTWVKVLEVMNQHQGSTKKRFENQKKAKEGMFTTNEIIKKTR